MMSPDLITVFRVFASGEPQTFDDLDTAMAYMRAQAANSEVLKSQPLTLESSQLTIKQYRFEVDGQETE